MEEVSADRYLTENNCLRIVRKTINIMILSMWHIRKTVALIIKNILGTIFWKEMASIFLLLLVLHNINSGIRQTCIRMS